MRKARHRAECVIYSPKIVYQHFLSSPLMLFFTTLPPKKIFSSVILADFFLLPSLKWIFKFFLKIFFLYFLLCAKRRSKLARSQTILTSLPIPRWTQTELVHWREEKSWNLLIGVEFLPVEWCRGAGSSWKLREEISSRIAWNWNSYKINLKPLATDRDASIHLQSSSGVAISFSSRTMHSFIKTQFSVRELSAE